MGRYKVTCENCRGSEVLNERLSSYALQDGETLTIERTFAWCDDCQRVQWAELIPDLEELRSRNKGEPCSQTDERIAWRITRASPPRCLACGSTKIRPGRLGETRSGNPKWVLDCPKCGGTIRILMEPAFVNDRGWLHFSPEGEFLQEYQMSPYRGAVPVNRSTQS
jgi:hypothetical protein